MLTVEPFAGGRAQPIAGAPKVPTFKELSEQWTSGALAKRYPDPPSPPTTSSYAPKACRWSKSNLTWAIGCVLKSANC